MANNDTLSSNVASRVFDPPRGSSTPAFGVYVGFRCIQPRCSAIDLAHNAETNRIERSPRVCIHVQCLVKVTTSWGSLAMVTHDEHTRHGCSARFAGIRVVRGWRQMLEFIEA